MKKVIFSFFIGLIFACAHVPDAPPPATYEFPLKELEIVEDLNIKESDPVDEEYRVGPKDILKITQWIGDEEKVYEVEVLEDGTISFFLIKDLKVADLTALEIKNAIVSELSLYIKRPIIEVTVKEYRSKKVALLGEIGAVAIRTDTGPAIYYLKGKTTIIDLISHAGGPTPKANLSKVRIIRNGKRYCFDLYKTLLYGDQTQNPLLQDKDVIFVPELGIVPEENVVYVMGNVPSPGPYFFKARMDLLSAIGMAGGLTLESRKGDILVMKRDGEKLKVAKVNFSDLIHEKPGMNYPLEGGEIVYVNWDIITQVSSFVGKLMPVLDLFLYPGRYRDLYGK